MVGRVASILVPLTFVCACASSGVRPAGMGRSVFGSEFRTRGAAEGERAPKGVDCYAHCEAALREEPESKNASEADVREYGFGCVSRCVVQRSDRAGLQCYVAMAAASQAEWQELYLARDLVEKTAYCLREAGDKSEGAQALLSAVATEQATRVTKDANKREREALLSGEDGDAQAARKARREANASPEWLDALSAFQRFTATDESAERLMTCLDALPLRACGVSPP